MLSFVTHRRPGRSPGTWPPGWSLKHVSVNFANWRRGGVVAWLWIVKMATVVKKNLFTDSGVSKAGKWSRTDSGKMMNRWSQPRNQTGGSSTLMSRYTSYLQDSPVNWLTQFFCFDTFPVNWLTQFFCFDTFPVNWLTQFFCFVLVPYRVCWRTLALYRENRKTRIEKHEKRKVLSTFECHINHTTINHRGLRVWWVSVWSWHWR